MTDNKRTYLRERLQESGEIDVKADAAIGLIAAGIGWIFLDRAAAIENLVGALGIGFGSAVVYQACHFLWRFVWVAPRDIHFENLGQIARLERERAELAQSLQKRQGDQVLADALTERYKSGVQHLLNKPPVDENDIERWRAEEAAWTRDVLKLMKEHGCTPQDINHVETIGLFPLLLLHPNETVCRDLSMFAVRLSRVADVSTKYAG